MDLEQCSIDTGIQKYLDGYEISPHPDLRKKVLTFMININTSEQAFKESYHTHYLEFKINKNEMINSTKIDFKFEGLISPFNLRINPDARKLGMLLKNFSINEL